MRVVVVSLVAASVAALFGCATGGPEDNASDGLYSALERRVKARRDLDVVRQHARQMRAWRQALTRVGHLDLAGARQQQLACASSGITKLEAVAVAAEDTWQRRENAFHRDLAYDYAVAGISLEVAASQAREHRSAIERCVRVSRLNGVAAR